VHYRFLPVLFPGILGIDREIEKIMANAQGHQIIIINPSAAATGNSAEGNTAEGLKFNCSGEFPQ
jgi:dTDP-4-amino-4,6-dideoxygalactose transaminase